MTRYMWFASGMWLLLLTGYRFRHRRWVHVPLMLSAITGDVVLVLYLELTRNAIGTALEFKLSTLQQIHIGVSTVALLLYLPTVALGIQLLRGKEQFRRHHRRFALSALMFRTLGFFFMFSMWKD